MVDLTHPLAWRSLSFMTMFLSGRAFKRGRLLVMVESNQPDVARTQSRATVETINKKGRLMRSPVLITLFHAGEEYGSPVAIAENQNRECYFMLPDS
mgnify:CR=1 FL=1